MSNGNDQPHGGLGGLPRSTNDAGGGSLFGEPHPPVPARTSSGSLFDDPTIQTTLSHSVGDDGRGRILLSSEPSPPFDPYGSQAPQPQAWTHDPRPAPPFASPAGARSGLEQSRLERVMEAAYRWRSLLGLGLAALMTTAIVIAYRGASDNGTGDISESASQTVAARSDSTQPDGDGSVPPGGSQAVGSSVGEIATTTLPPFSPSQTSSPAATGTSTTRRAATTTAATSSTTAKASTSSSAGSSTTLPGESTTSSSDTTIPSSTTPTTVGSSTSASGGSTTLPLELVRLEAEAGTLLGQATVANDHLGASGTGFVTDIAAPGRGVTVTTERTVAGPVPLRIRFSAGNTQLPDPNRSLTLRVNGVDIGPVIMAQTASFDVWDNVDVDITLKAGTNTITLIMGPGDNGSVNIDYLEVGAR